jgi:hypothetical protein
VQQHGRALIVGQRGDRPAHDGQAGFGDEFLLAGGAAVGWLNRLAADERFIQAAVAALGLAVAKGIEGDARGDEVVKSWTGKGSSARSR